MISQVVVVGGLWKKWWWLVRSSPLPLTRHDTGRRGTSLHVKPPEITHQSRSTRITADCALVTETPTANYATSADGTRLAFPAPSKSAIYAVVS
jgi:hypothetical protein